MSHRHHYQLLLLLLFPVCLSAQKDVEKISAHFIQTVSGKAVLIKRQLDKKSSKILTNLLKQEAKLRRKLDRKDSLTANSVFGNADQQYQLLQQKLKITGFPGNYIPSLDTLTTSLKFLENQPELLSNNINLKDKLTASINQLNELQSQFQQAKDINSFIKHRKEFLKTELSRFGMAKDLKKINKQIYYYGAQVKEYKETLKDFSKAERKAIDLLRKTKLFQDFMRQHSQLASLFPSSNTATSAQASLAGLQTRAQVNSLIQQNLAAGGPDARVRVSEQLQQAQTKLSELKDRAARSIGGNKGDEIPEDFKPNSQKTKSFLQRLELGTNVQSQKPNGYFPVTSDIGLSAGYKLNDRSIVGLGASYKIGWGKSIRQISISHEGVGLRSYIEWKLKGSFWATGGYERNYLASFRHIADLKDKSAWQESGLLGLSKTVEVRSKMVQKMKFQLLWDFLSYQQLPRQRPIVFRVGYTWH